MANDSTASFHLENVYVIAVHDCGTENKTGYYLETLIFSHARKWGLLIMLKLFRCYCSKVNKIVHVLVFIWSKELTELQLIFSAVFSRSRKCIYFTWLL